MKRFKLIEFSQHKDEYGSLTPIEENKEVPFRIRRVYYIYDVDNGITRGYHSHKKLEQILICLSGEIEITLKSRDENNKILLDNPKVGLYIGPNLWREMKFIRNNSILLVLASELYDESDYIRNFDDYVIYKGDND